MHKTMSCEQLTDRENRSETPAGAFLRLLASPMRRRKTPFRVHRPPSACENEKSRNEAIFQCGLRIGGAKLGESVRCPSPRIDAGRLPPGMNAGALVHTEALAAENDPIPDSFLAL